MPTSEWLQTELGIPSGGVSLVVTYERGNQTSSMHLPLLQPTLTEWLGGPLYPGSLNLRADAAVQFPDPAVRALGGRAWQLAAVVVGERAVGIAARRADSGDIDFIEVFGRHKIAERLSLHPGARVQLRILPGWLLESEQPGT